MLGRTLSVELTGYSVPDGAGARWDADRCRRTASQRFSARLLLAACSLTVRGPSPAQPVSAPPTCTRTAGGRLVVDAPPALLGTLTGGLLVGAIAADGGCRDSGPCDTALNVGAMVLTMGVMYSLAIVHNVRSTNACQGAWARHEEWLEEHTEKRRPGETSACALLLEDWRGEPHRGRKAQKWAEMPAACRQRVPDPAGVMGAGAPQR